MTTQEMIGKYRMVRHIATGGMAEIWLAEQEGPGGFSKQLVIKRILPHLARDQHFTQMFLDEARTVAQLTHPNIAQIFELGQAEDDYFIAMEFIEGVDASVLIELALERDVEIPIEVAVRVVADALRALDYAHTFSDRDGVPLGLVHRDVTPHNILVSNDGVVKLVDFGVAKAKENQSKTQTGAVKGKYAYMAPEQIQSSDVDARVDVFAAGVVLCELLTRVKPFGDDLAAVNAILTKPPIDPRSIRPEVPAELVEILAIALEKDAERRYRTADVMARDLDEFSRVSGHHCSNRELADFVRELQGIAPVRTGRVEATGPRARLTEREPTPFGTSPDSGRFVAEPSTQPGAFAPTAEISAVASPTLAEPAFVASSVASESPAPRGNGALIAAFAFLILAIVGAGVGVIAMSIDSGDSPEKPKVGKKDKPADEPEVKKELPTPNPKMLAHDDGNLVIVNVEKGAEIFYEGVLVGRTRMTTNLRPGSYDVVVKANGKEVARKLEVGSAGVNQIKLESP